MKEIEKILKTSIRVMSAHKHASKRLVCGYAKSYLNAAKYFCSAWGNLHLKPEEYKKVLTNERPEGCLTYKTLYNYIKMPDTYTAIDFLNV